MSLEKHLSLELIEGQIDLFKLKARLEAAVEFLGNEEAITGEEKEVCERVIGTIAWLENWLANLNSAYFHRVINKSEN